MKVGRKMPLWQLPAGSLFLYEGRTVALKTEYRTSEGAIEAFIVGSGEMFWGGATNWQEQTELMVQEIDISLFNH